MTISRNSVVYYKDLINNSEEMIIDVCQNVGSYRDVPAIYKSGGSGRTDNIPRSEGHVGFRYVATYFTYTPVITEQINLVQESTIRSEFESFMSSRGILAKDEQPVTTRGMINFYNNLAAFCSVKVIVVQGDPYTTTNPAVIFYRDGDISIPEISVSRNGDLLTKEDVDDSMQLLIQSMNNVNKGYGIQYKYEGHSSSCSSSSSSSSCSSSSNCSSIFIAYMKI